MGATTALLISSALMTGAQAFTQSRAIKSSGEYESQAYAANARFATLQAEDAILRGEKESVAHGKQVKQLIGKQRASLGAQGLDLESGSALDVQLETAGLGAEDELTIRNNAWREAWGYRVQAADYMTQASFAKLAAKNKARNTLLTGGISAVRDLGFAAYSARGMSTSSGSKIKTSSGTGYRKNIYNQYI